MSSSRESRSEIAPQELDGLDDPHSSERLASDAGADRDANRRASERFFVTWSVDCETEDTFLYATITNISEMGIFVGTLQPLPVGTQLRLRFAPPGLGKESEFVLDGQVQWINPNRPTCPNPGMGVLFVSLTLDDRERLVEVIRTIAYLPANALST